MKTIAQSLKDLSRKSLLALAILLAFPLIACGDSDNMAEQGNHEIAELEPGPWDEPNPPSLIPNIDRDEPLSQEEIVGLVRFIEDAYRDPNLSRRRALRWKYKGAYIDTLFFLKMASQSEYLVGVGFYNGNLSFHFEHGAYDGAVLVEYDTSRISDLYILPRNCFFC